jgi:hypothetical protein
VRRNRPADPAGAFAREWNFAFGLIVAIAALLFVNGHHLLGAIAIGLGATAFIARRSAMRRQNRGFYGQEKQPR